MLSGFQWLRDRAQPCQILYFFWQFSYVAPETRGLE